VTAFEETWSWDCPFFNSCRKKETDSVGKLIVARVANHCDPEGADGLHAIEQRKSTGV
jgi:hypothetical protein